MGYVLATITGALPWRQQMVAMAFLSSYNVLCAWHPMRSKQENDQGRLLEMGLAQV